MSSRNASIVNSLGKSVVRRRVGSGARASGREGLRGGATAIPQKIAGRWWPSARVGSLNCRACRHRRSEEHTSELQSLMRISYAVFCLQKQTKKPQTNKKIL